MLLPHIFTSIREQIQTNLDAQATTEGDSFSAEAMQSQTVLRQRKPSFNISLLRNEQLSESRQSQTSQTLVAHSL
jgi:hypothetical protein